MFENKDIVEPKRKIKIEPTANGIKIKDGQYSYRVTFDEFELVSGSNGDNSIVIELMHPITKEYLYMLYYDGNFINLSRRFNLHTEYNIGFFKDNILTVISNALRFINLDRMEMFPFEINLDEFGGVDIYLNDDLKLQVDEEIVFDIHLNPTNAFLTNGDILLKSTPIALKL